MGLWDKETKEFYGKHWRDKNNDPERPLCSFCGQQWVSAHWSLQVFVCPDCAVEVLPKLIADAVDRPHFDTQDFKRYADKIMRTFWYAASSCLSRRIRNGPRSRIRDQFKAFFWNGDVEGQNEAEDRG